MGRHTHAEERGCLYRLLLVARHRARLSVKVSAMRKAVTGIVQRDSQRTPSGSLAPESLREG